MYLISIAEFPSILEHFEPGADGEVLPLVGSPGPLPAGEDTLRMGHHGEVTAILGTEGGNAIGTAVGVEGILLSDLVGIIDVTERSEVVRHDVGMDLLLGEVEATFTVSDPDAERRAGHALEHDCGTLLDLDTAESALELTTVVLQKSRLLLGGHALAVGDPSKESHELTAIADAQTEGIGAIPEGLELLEDTLVELDDTSPTLATVQNIGVGETSHKDDTTELVQGNVGGEQVIDTDIPGLETSRDER